MRWSFTLSGGASLGAFEAGAIAALFRGVQSVQPEEGESPLVVDAIGGSSAGAIVGFLGALCLLRGLEPVDLLYWGWVEQIELDVLLGTGGRSPMDTEELEKRFRDLLCEDGEELSGDQPKQREPILFNILLTGLRGLKYELEGSVGPTSMGLTFADWRPFEMTGEETTAELFDDPERSLGAFVFASAAHPGAFAPRLLDRSEDRDLYEKNGLDLPDHGRLWYTDGDFVQSEPIGGVLEAVDRVDERVHIVIDPRSEGPSGANRWADPDQEPTWAEGVTRAMSIISAQSLYDDMRRIRKANERLVRLKKLVAALAPHLGDDAHGALAEFVGEDGETDALLETALREVAALDGKYGIEVDVVSPLLLDEENEGVEALLAGNLLGDFGGFLQEELRKSDFLLGYDAARSWLHDRLDTWVEEKRMGEDVAKTIREAVDDARVAPWDSANVGQIDFSDLDLAARAEVARLAKRYLRVLAQETWRGIRSR